MPVNRAARLLALIAAALLLMGATCNRGNDDEADETEPPSETPTVVAVADFQLVGLIDEAFAGQLPPVDLPADAFDRSGDTIDATSSPGATPGASPSPVGAPVGAQPTRGGIIRLTIEDLSEDLREACGLAAESVVHVYWTTSTFFEPADVLDDVEDKIEDRTAGISGRIFRSDELGDTTEPTPAATAATTVSPAATGSPEATTAPTVAADCLLVAEQIAFTATTLPTPRPAAPRTAAPTAAPTSAPTATPSPTATAPPATSAPAATPTTSPTDEPSPT